MAFYNDISKYNDNVVILDDEGQSISYRELDEFCDRIGVCVKERSVVFSLCDNSIGAISGYIAFLAGGVVPLLLDRHIEEALRNHLIENYEPEYLYMQEKMQDDFGEMRCIHRERGYVLLETGYNRKYKLYKDLALLLTTSGSTGSPKLVRQSYENIQANAESIAKYLEITRTERPITTLPMNYTYGLSIINSHILCGGTILATNYTLMDRRFWDFFKKGEATSFGGVPYTYEMLKKLRFFRMDLPSLRTMTQAGGKMSPELHREFAEYAAESGKKFIVMYGQCEATARMAYLPAEKAVEKYGSMGIAIPGGKLELVDTEGRVIESADVAGELVYTGKNVTLGYAEKAEDLAKGDERFGRLETGDIAKRDQEGYYYIVGRKKRFLKIFGNRVNLDEIEGMIKREFGENMDCACGGVDDKLYVFIAGDSEEMVEQLRQFLTKKTRLHPSAIVVKMLEQIPKNEAGQTLYGELEEFYHGI